MARQATLDVLAEARAVDERVQDATSDGWAVIVAVGNKLLKQNFAEKTQPFFDALRVALAYHAWPPEVSRPVPKLWPAWARAGIERDVREVDTYDHYLVTVCGDELLRLSDGTQAVMLRRRYVGGARSLAGNHTMSMGVPGEADLQGSLTIELPTRLLGKAAVPLALEVKSAKGVLNPDQLRWREAVVRRGWIYVLARSTEEAVTGICTMRDWWVKNLT